MGYQWPWFRFGVSGYQQRKEKKRKEINGKRKGKK
jgi:hypothetical protein